MLHLRSIITIGAIRFQCAEVLFQPRFPSKMPADTRHFFPDHQEVRRRYPQRVIRQCRDVSGTTYSKIFFRHDEGIDCVVSSAVKVKVVASIRYGLGDQSCLPSTRPAECAVLCSFVMAKFFLCLTADLGPAVPGAEDGATAGLPPGKQVVQLYTGR